jgi:O-antigen ligase
MLAPAAVLFGAAYVLSADRVSPWVMPGLVLGLVGAWFAYRRPEVGIALGLVLIPAHSFGFNARVTTYLVLAWSAYVAAAAYLHSTYHEQRVGWPVLGWLVVAYLCVSLLSLTQATDIKLGQGMARNILTGGLLFAATFWAVRDRPTLTWVLGGFAAGGLLVGLHAARDYGTGNYTGFGFVTSAGELVGRVSAGFAHPNELGGFLVLIVPLAIAGVFVARRARTLYIAGAVVAAIGVYASFSRGALIALALVPFVFLRGWRVWLAAPLVAALFLLATPTLVKERFATLTSSGAEMATREDIWRVAVNIFENHPVLGVGLGNFPDAYANAPLAGKQFLPSTIYKPPPHAHDLFLQLMAEQGIIGLLAFLAILFVAIRTTLRLRAGPRRWIRVLGSGLLASLIAVVAQDLFDVTIQDPQTGLYLFLLLGLIAACGRNWAGTEGTLA